MRNLKLLLVACLLVLFLTLLETNGFAYSVSILNTGYHYIADTNQTVNLFMPNYTKFGKAQYWKLATELVAVFFGLSNLLIAILIVFENRSSSRTVAWLLVLLAFPILGFVLYILIGQKPRKRKKVKDHLQADDLLQLKSLLDKQLKMLDGPEHAIDKNIYAKKRLVNLILNNFEEPFTIHNTSQVLTNGQETFDAICESINKAEHHVHLEYYTIRPDRIGHKIRDLLIEKAKAGVMVRLLYDAVGSRSLNRKFLEPLWRAKAEVGVFLPVKLPFFHSKMNYRNHRKILVVDGRTGYVGGLNIGDEYLSKGELGFWRDTHLEIKGEAVAFLQRIFLLDWHFATGNSIVSPQYFPVQKFQANQPIQIASGGPDSERASIQQVYFATISSAQEKIFITTPYFVPDESIITALKTAALSGIDVRLVFPAIPDKRLVHWASMSYIKEVLEAGVKVYLYQKGFIHAKILLVDGVVASVGTANMDMRSFALNFEVNALIYDREVVSRLEKDFIADISCSRLVTYEQFLNKPLWSKFKESGARILSPML
ncbi:phospholipase D/Transphosphatidylase [Desulfofarcimen acetoxidans DSM 771]|jgi:cardiolipin synthase|uniref:Cardiolipin synthase n=1 Tax=Desulfofarcimen acetoxidans (strain ATCC 49208 / DSM 771 / KCTC 5769 / VKM B-1644 / 5575) TaxID=485916 RepID=C8W5E6_DESAS|nr:cardiolipin synthase [Desulfofarcimen acetoxidans]ACV62128.1 phospholipase D/Transphosphatidylase [Desulfofarcimen acetoxidans DSM 771]